MQFTPACAVHTHTASCMETEVVKGLYHTGMQVLGPKGSASYPMSPEQSRKQESFHYARGEACGSWLWTVASRFITRASCSCLGHPGNDAHPQLADPQGSPALFMLLADTPLALTADQAPLCEL